MKDTLTICKRCKGNACYEQEVDEKTKTYLCFSCGFTTSTVMKRDSLPVKRAIDSSPELYKDLQYTDDQGYVWLPSVISIPNKGMVFIDGTSGKNWQWKAAKAVPLEENDKKLSPDQTHKMDMKNAKTFSERDFIDALDAIEFFKLN
jgi:ribosomal protein L37E